MDTVAEPTLFKKGAEASLYLAEWHGRKVVIKVRIPKNIVQKRWISRFEVTEQCMSRS